jgi:stalled ribosome rescue protein Dom34
MKNSVLPRRTLGVYMDHSAARLLEPLANSFIAKEVKSGLTHAEREYALSKSEHLMHEKERGEYAKYYNEIAEHIRHFDEVLLFGPTTAKDELYNMLRDDAAYAAIKITVKSSDKLPENQQEAFVRDYFASH